MTQQNDPELQQQGKYLGTISKDFVQVADTLKEASYLLRKRNISSHPVFPASKEPLPVGAELLPATDGREWIFNISFLDEMIQRKLIDADKVEEFKAVYKNPDEFCCLFVIDKTFINFVFIPFPDDDDLDIQSAID